MKRYSVYLLAGLIVVVSAGMAVAGTMESGASDGAYLQARSLDAENGVGQPEQWLVNEPVETGSMPGVSNSPIESGAFDDSGTGFESDRHHPDADAGGGSD